MNSDGHPSRDHKMGKSEQALRTLRRQGRYLEAFELAEKIGWKTLCASGAVVEVIRCHLLRGSFGEVLRTGDRALEEEDLPSDLIALRIGLWRAHARVHAEGRLGVSRADLQPALARASRARHPLERLTWGKITLIAATYLVAGERELLLSRSELEAAAEEFLEAGEIEDAIETWITLARSASPNQARGASDLSLAIHSFQNALEVADGASLHHLRGACLLGLADLAARTEEDQTRAEPLFRQARQAFNDAGHLHGPFDVERTRFLHRLRQGESPDDMAERCRAGYRQQGYLLGLHSLLSSWGSTCFRAGDMARARALFEEAHEVALAAGSRPMEWGSRLSLANTYGFSGEYSKAVDSHRSLLTDDVPELIQIHSGLLLANVYLTMNDPAEAVALLRRALVKSDHLGAATEGVTAAISLANTLASQGDLAGADNVLDERIKIEQDRGRSLEAAQMLKHRGDLQIHGSGRSPHLESPALATDATAAAQKWYEKALSLVSQESSREARSLRAEILQGRARVDLVLDQITSGLVHIRAASEEYRQLGLHLHAANCSTIEGLLHLKHGQERSQPKSLLAAAEALTRSLQTFERSEMFQQSQRARFLLASALVELAPRVAPGEQPELRRTCRELLKTYHREGTRSRLSLVLRDTVESQEARIRLLDQDEQAYRLAIHLSTRLDGSPETGLEWEERRKSRVLVDALARTPLPALAATMPDELLAQEQAFLEAIRLAASDQEARELSNRLSDLYDRASTELDKPEYLQLRRGQAATAEEIRRLLISQRAPGQRVVLVEYALSSRGILLFTLDSEGSSCQVAEIPVPLQQVESFVAQTLGSSLMRRFHLAQVQPRELHALDALVAPLARLCEPEDLLYVIPSGPLHRLPLHALQVDGAPLIERNPVVYAPSATVLRFCMARARRASSSQDPQRVSIFGDPSEDRSASRRCALQLGERFGVVPSLGAQVTRSSLEHALRNSDLVHFQGHAVFNATAPLDSHLRLAKGQTLRARDFFELIGSRARLLALGACESGAHQVAAGDELLGLPRALLYAGISTLSVTLWPVFDDSTAYFMERFYGGLSQTESPAAKPLSSAQALRRAMLETREHWPQVYHWAPFQLMGDWR